MIVCTSVCSNYLPKAMVMAKSLKKYHPSCKVVVCLVEKEIPKEAKDSPYFDYIVLAKDLGFPNFNAFIFKHTIVEASTAVKGRLFLYLLNHFTEEKSFIYLDPDILILGPFEELENALTIHPIIVTPHLLHPEDTLRSIKCNEISTLKHGIFNLGFLAIQRSKEAKRFINWWADRLDVLCFDDKTRGIFTDQKWVDLAICFFDTHILKHSGYNVAPWNLSKRKIQPKGNKEYLANDEKLRFFHFSGLDSGACDRMIQYFVPDRNNAVYTIRQLYQRELVATEKIGLGSIPWSFDTYHSGEKISKDSRLVYRNSPALQKKYKNPFAKSNKAFLG